VDARAPAGDYLVADATVRYSGLSHWEFAASVHNLFDEDAREYMRSSVPDDLPLAGRSFYLEARYEF
jgi:outer membrane receptor protein involved in Fe transport